MPAIIATCPRKAAGKDADTTLKNKKLMPEKLEIKKFDRVARKHLIYKETKLK